MECWSDGVMKKNPRLHYSINPRLHYRLYNSKYECNGPEAVIPDTFIHSNLQGLSFIGPEMILTVAILILLGLGVILSFRRQRLLCTLVAVAALAGSLLDDRATPPCRAASAPPPGTRAQSGT